MMLTVSYATKEKVFVTAHTYHHVYKRAELKPIAINRIIAARTKKGNRYYYDGVFDAPHDADFSVDYDGKKVIYCNIFRKLNPHFNPKKLAFNGNTAKSIELERMK